VNGFVKRRDRPVPGSIPHVLDMFRAEVRFYREIAPVVGVRVPACLHSDITPDGTLLVLEDLSAWRAGADPVAYAHLLSGLHQRWAERAAHHWPWLRRAGAAADLVGDLFDQTWPAVTARRDLTDTVRTLGRQLFGRVASVGRGLASAGPVTLIHGDASMANIRTGPAGELALLDWEDVSAAAGVADLAWLLLSSVDPAQWTDVTAAYGPAAQLAAAMPAAAVQAVLSLADTVEGSADARGWVDRLEAAERLLVG